MVSFGDVVKGIYGLTTLPYLPRSPVRLGSPLTIRGRGKGSSGVGFGWEYGTFSPGVRRVMEMAKVDCSGLLVVDSCGTLAGGTGI